MLDIILESARFLILLFITIFLVRSDKDVEYGLDGWKCIKYGFMFILFGSFVDITDNFEQLNWTILLGDTPGQAFLEKVVGYLGGFTLLAIGLWHWLPKIQEVGRLEKAYRKQKEQADFIYENVPVGIARGRIGDMSNIHRNQEFATMLGYDSPKEMLEIGKAKQDLGFIWHDKEVLHTLIEQLRTEFLIPSVEVRFIHKDGSIVWALLDFMTLKNEHNDNEFFYCFAKDITKQKAMVATIAENEQRLKTIIDAMPTGIYLVDVATQTIVDANLGATTLSGYTREELIGSHCCDRLCPRRKGECPLIREGSDVRYNETSFTRKDGSEFAVMKTAVRVRMGGKDYLLETFVDISEQKRLEQLKEDVDRIVQHDLRSPISSAISAATIALLDESVQGEPREMLETIKKKGHKVLDMMGLSLAMYKMEAGTFEYIPEHLDLMKMVSHALSELGDNLREKQLTPLIRLNGKQAKDRSALYIAGNKLLIQSVLSNLLKNCVDATDIGGEFTLDIVRDGNVSLTFTNPGVVPQEIRETFFDKYATSGKRHGTGLGTYSAKLITNTMGGTIAMKTSDETNQTTVTVSLPGDIE